mgnify:CR=1 FL=1
MKLFETVLGCLVMTIGLVMDMLELFPLNISQYLHRIDFPASIEIAMLVGMYLLLTMALIALIKWCVRHLLGSD